MEMPYLFAIPPQNPSSAPTWWYFLQLLMVPGWVGSGISAENVVMAFTELDEADGLELGIEVCLPVKVYVDTTIVERSLLAFSH